MFFSTNARSFLAPEHSSSSFSLTSLFNNHPAPPPPPLEDICVCHYVLNETGRSVPRLPGFHSPLSPSDECLHRRPDHSSVLNGDVSLSLFPGGLPLRRPPHGGRRAAVPPRSSRGRHHAQREEARGQQQQRRAVQM